MKKLPIGIQSFRNLREGGYVYVDKTKQVYEMVENGKVYFLSRPRRFGKSRLVSVMDELFSGRKELFEGLHIYNKWDWEKKYPVIRLDFGAGDYSSNEKLINSLSDFLKNCAEKFGIILKNTTIPTKFSELIHRIHLKTSEPVVVLIDEYDKPILDVINNPQVSKENKEFLHGFYQVLKASDDHLKFAFLTGVSKFAGLSVFSALNNLKDITLSDDFSGICGYTQEELEKTFVEHIEHSANKLALSKRDLLDRIRLMYDGYSWDGNIKVYNPFSTLMFFSESRFENYWYRTGTPTFLIEAIKNKNQILNVLEEQILDSSFFDSADIDDVDETSLLFQAGYLTVKNRVVKENTVYTLGLPNTEVKDAFLKHLLTSYSKFPVGKIQGLKETIQEQIKNSDAGGLEQSLKMLFAHIPYRLKEIENENYYGSLFLLTLAILDFDIQGEAMTNLGRIDAVLRMSSLNIVAEFKFCIEESLDAMLDEAIKQIYDKRYYESYMNKPVILLGMAFSGSDLKCRFEKLKQ
ncbi:MAG: AAA family ATPase [Endomicrobium sp.]|jgi:hypothetical protein|nr:AAA family ATPase [Endomicrobium sp.]